MTKIKCRLMLVISGLLANSSFYMNEPLKGTDCLQKSFDGIFILPDKVSFMSWALLCLQRYRGNHYISEAPPTGREWMCIFNNPVCSFCSDQCEIHPHKPVLNIIIYTWLISFLKNGLKVQLWGLSFYNLFSFLLKLFCYFVVYNMKE